MTELEKAKQREADGTKALIDLINNAYLASGFVLAGDTENGKHLSDELRRSINKVKKVFFVEEEN
jgi:hypothetical protein